MNARQTDIFRSDAQQLAFAELCNALYERELLQLAHSNNKSLLPRRLKGLSHHIRHAAEAMMQHDGPLEVDVHNASWQSKQAARCPAKPAPEKCQQWFSQHAQLGMPVPIRVHELGMEHLELDSVDRIDAEEGLIHTNKYGWFALTGSHQEHDRYHLLIPTKATLTAACCGHGWKHNKKAQPRALTLRELLLSNQINWKDPKKPMGR
ncbi:hypothetical protein HMF8227_02073 [Saliniradius amylolyticus]|uniref:Uncharacterized protein n=1 Tax=Saliniradius amylolyticus TaxID=2183582 RepID=A0A2S2E4G1_9ALTE|nr:hypothetical protein [Saliniradius amylolyticus]AWL12534.1 hypothetical protein HMF8227_02073 [Saliniradius amylolyticus]